MYSKIKNWKEIKEIKSIDELGLTKYEAPFNPELFYKYKDGIYCPYIKRDIQAYIDPLEPETFLPFIKAFDIPFSPNKWIKDITYLLEENKSLINVFGRYLSYCKLKGFRYFSFENSDEFQELFITPEEKAYKQGYDQAMKDLEEKINNEKFHNTIKNILEDILKDYKLVKK